MASPLLGKTIRWTFADGPVAGKTFEHVFNDDGSVDWCMVDGDERSPLHHESPASVDQIDDEVAVVSYRASSGYTLTVVLDLTDFRMIGFGSNSDMWSRQEGRFDVLK